MPAIYVVLLWCYCGATVMLLWCYCGATVVGGFSSTGGLPLTQVRRAAVAMDTRRTHSGHID